MFWNGDAAEQSSRLDINAVDGDQGRRWEGQYPRFRKGLFSVAEAVVNHAFDVWSVRVTGK